MDERAYNISLGKKEKLLVPLNAASGDVRLVMAYPNRYWIAMSNLGFQAVYKLFAEQSRFSVERAYLPESGNFASIKTFESNKPVSSAEILAVSISFETDYSNVLHMLKSAGVDLSSCSELSRKERLRKGLEREDKNFYRPLTIAGGAAVTLNPEPLANFFDIIVVGEGEEVIQEISDVYLKCRDGGKSFEEMLYQMSALEGVYVPSLVDVNYAEDHRVEEFVNLDHQTFPVKRRFVKDISSFPSTTVIQTPETEFKSMYMTETGRGCEVGCKFCVAGYMYRPVRKRDESTLADTVKIGIESGDSVGFVGAAVSSHPKISKLASSVAAAGKRAALSSIMSQRVTPELAGSLSESEYKTVALAPEAGSEELRFKIGKRVCNQQILDGVRTLASEGIRNFKLYFIVGLPAETQEDVQAIVDLVKAAQLESMKGAREQEGEFKIAPKVILSVNPFIPKAWTPFQRHGFLGFSGLKKKLKKIRSGIAGLPNVEMKNESPRESYFQALLSRGDRRVGDLLIYLNTYDLDWRWLVKNGSKEIIPGVPPAEFYVEREMRETEILPWEAVDFGVKRKLLEREYIKTFDFDYKPLIERARASLSIQDEQNNDVKNMVANS